MSGLSFGRFEGLFEYALLKDGNNKVPTSISVGDVEFIESFITELVQFYDGAVLESFVFKIKEDIGLYKLGNPICQTCLLVYFLVDLSLQLGSLRMADENILKRMIWLRIVHRIKSILEYSEPLKKKSLMNPVPSYFFYLERLMYESYLVGDEFPACTAALNGTLLATFGSDFTTLKKICHLFRLLVWKRFPELLLFPPLVSLKQNFDFGAFPTSIPAECDKGFTQNPFSIGTFQKYFTCQPYEACLRLFECLLPEQVSLFYYQPFSDPTSKFSSVFSLQDNPLFALCLNVPTLVRFLSPFHSEMLQCFNEYCLKFLIITFKHLLFGEFEKNRKSFSQIGYDIEDLTNYFLLYESAIQLGLQKLQPIKESRAS